MTSHSGHGFLSIFFGDKYDLIQLHRQITIQYAFSPQNYHHHQQFLSKFRENNENDMTSVVWAGTAFGPRLWPLSACRHSLADRTFSYFLFKFKENNENDMKFCYFSCLGR